MRYVLLYFAIKYNGNWEKIYKALCVKEKARERDLSSLKQENHDNWISLIDDNYPEEFKFVFKPPFVLFLEGNKKLLKQYNKDNRFVMLTNFFGKDNLDLIKKDFLNKDWENKISNSVFFVEYENTEIIKSLLDFKTHIIAINKKCKSDIEKDELYKLLIKNNSLIISYGLSSNDLSNMKS